MINLNYDHTDKGHARVCFKLLWKKSRQHFCIQEGISEPELLACSKDWEPSHKVRLLNKAVLFYPKNIDNYALNLIKQWEELWNEKSNLCSPQK